MIGGVLVLASCSSSSINNSQQADLARIDSIARAKAAQQDIINQKKNDSTINALAVAKADSTEKAEGISTKQPEKPEIKKNIPVPGPQAAEKTNTDHGLGNNK